MSLWFWLLIFSYGNILKASTPKQLFFTNEIICPDESVTLTCFQQLIFIESGAYGGEGTEECDLQGLNRECAVGNQLIKYFCNCKDSCNLKDYQEYFSFLCPLSKSYFDLTFGCVDYDFYGCNQRLETTSSVSETSEARTTPVWTSSSATISTLPPKTNLFSTPLSSTDLSTHVSIKVSTSSKTFSNQSKATSFSTYLPKSVVSSISTNVTTVTTKTNNAFLSAEYIIGIAISVFLFIVLFAMAALYYFKQKQKPSEFFRDIFNTSSKSQNAHAADTKTYSKIYTGKINRALIDDHQDVSLSNSYETVGPTNNNKEVETSSGIKMTENILYHSYRSEKDVPTNDLSLSTKNLTSSSKAASTDVAYDFAQNVADSSKPSKMTENILYDSYQAGVSENKNENCYEVVGNNVGDPIVLQVSSEYEKNDSPMGSKSDLHAPHDLAESASTSVTSGSAKTLR